MASDGRKTNGGHNRKHHAIPATNRNKRKTKAETALDAMGPTSRKKIASFFNALCSAHFPQYTEAAKGALCTGKGSSHGKKKKDNNKEPTALSLPEFGSDFSLGGHLLDIMSRGESVSQ